MTIRKTIRLFLVAGGLCAGLWQAAHMLEMIEQAKASGTCSAGAKGHAGVLSAFAGAGTPTDLAMQASAKSAQSNNAVEDLLSQLRPDAKPKKDELVIFAPGGTQLSDEERQRLLKEAERLRPKPKEQKK